MITITIQNKYDELASFDKPALDSTLIINKLANVDAGFAVSSKDLTEAIRRVGEAAENASITLNQFQTNMSKRIC